MVRRFGSQMHLKYTHYFGNESSEELLESYGVETKKKGQRQDVLKPKQCPNCNESNIPDSKFCAKCRMVLTYDAYSETLENEKQKDDKIGSLENTVNTMQSQLQSLISAFSSLKDQKQVDGMAKMLYGSRFIKEASSTSSTSSDTEDTNDIDDTESAKKDKLIKEAGKAAYHATISKSALSRGKIREKKSVNIESSIIGSKLPK